MTTYDRPLGVYLAGAHSTGKSTLQNAMRGVIQMDAVIEVARGVIRQLGMTRDQFDPQTHPETFENLQLKIMEAQCDAERNNELDGIDCLYDRCIDPVVYAQTYLGEEAANRLMTHAATGDCISRYRKSLVLVITPQPECVQDDGFRLPPRFTDLENFTDDLTKLLTKLDIPYTLIDVLDLNQRVDIVKKLVEKHRPDLICDLNKNKHT